MAFESVQQIVIAQGMREDIDPRLLPPGTPKLLKNVRTRQQGRIEKRPGSLNLFSDGLPTSVRGCWVSEYAGLPVFCVEDESAPVRSVYAQIPSAFRWTEMGRSSPVMPERRFGLVYSAESYKQVTCAAVGELLYVAYIDATTGQLLWLSCVDPGGAVLASSSPSITAEAPRLVNVEGTLYLIYADPTGTAIYVSTVTLSTLALSAPTQVNATGGSLFDAAPIEGSPTHWIFACRENATTIRIRRMSGTSSATTATITTTNAATMIGVAAQSGGKVVIGYCDSTTIECGIMSETALSGATNTTVHTLTASEAANSQIGVCRTSSTEYALTWGGTHTGSSALTTSYIYHARISTAGVVSGTNDQVLHYTLASKPFSIGNRVFVWAHNRNDSTQNWQLQPAHFLLDLDASEPEQVCALSYEHLATYGQSQVFRAWLPEVASLGSGRFAAPLLWNDPGVLQGVDVAVFRIPLRTESALWCKRDALEVNGSLLVSGGLMHEHADAPNDGSYLSPNGFPYDPEIAVAASAGAGLTTGQEYSYRAVYRWTDAAGHVHRSAPSDPKAVTPSGGNLQVTITAAGIVTDGRAGSTNNYVYVEFYRSWLGGPYYYVGEGFNAPIVTFTDATSDATASAEAVLYTDTGVLPNDPPSGCRLMCSGGNRVFVVGWRENVVQFSKLIIATAPIEFSDDDTFRIFLPEAIRAIWWMDGALVVLCARSIYVVSGDGPNDQGVGSFAEPRRLPATVGCDEGSPVVETPQGLMFKAAGTIYLLPRGFGPPVPVGDAIQETLASYPVALGAYMCANESDECAHFVLGDADPPNSTIVAVYDVRLGTWSRDELNGAIGAANNVGGYFTWVLDFWNALEDLPVRQLSDTEDQDFDSNGFSAWIESRVDFGDLRPFGPLGWGKIGRIQILGEVTEACTVKLSTTLDGAALATVSKAYTTAAAPSYLEHALENFTGNSWRFSLFDAAPASNAKTRGAVFHAFAFEAQPEKGLRRVNPSTERMT